MLLSALLVRHKGPGGRPRTHPLREVVNGLLYVLRGGISWRMMPSDLPPWETVYDHFRRWTKNGTLEHVHAILRDAVRKNAGRDGDPSLMIIDSQSVQTTESGGVRGLDAGKKVKGRKRHIIVDTLGLVWAVVVHAADIQDAQGARLVLLKLLDKAPRLQVILADRIYRGSLALIARLLGGWVLEIVGRPVGARGFTVLPKRWIVERTFAWLGRNRRLSKDYEHLAQTSEAWIYLAMIQLMLRRLLP
jgi:putative transposase